MVSGEPTPVSVALRDEGGSYVPANPLVPISISKEAATGASFLSSGISVAPASAGFDGSAERCREPGCVG